MDILSVSGVSKRFGNKQVVKDLFFRVPENTIYGFIGKNGAGKTTTMKMILGLVKMDEGEILVNGEKVVFGQNQTNRYIGYLPDVPEFYTFMTTREYLQLCGRVTGMDEETIRVKSEELLELVGLAGEKKRIKGFSRGMKQRLGIAQALLNSPKLLICDEPTSALDPVGRKEILDVLSRVKEHTTVIFSTHILSDVERICDEIAFLNEGKIVMQGTLAEMKSKRKSSGIEIDCADAATAESVVRLWSDAALSGDVKVVVPATSDTRMGEVMRTLADAKLSVTRVEQMEPTLEDLFVEVVSQ